MLGTRQPTAYSGRQWSGWRAAAPDSAGTRIALRYRHIRSAGTSSQAAALAGEVCAMSVIARASLVEYFKDQLEGALAQQRVPVHADTAHYVVQLLADTMRHDRHGRAAALLDPRPLALRLAAAMDDRCPAPGQALRDVADAALLLATSARRHPRRAVSRQRTTTASAASPTAPWARNHRRWRRSSRTSRPGSPSMPMRSVKSDSEPKCRAQLGWCGRSSRGSGREAGSRNDCLSNGVSSSHGDVASACSNHGHGQRGPRNDMDEPEDADRSVENHRPCSRV